MLECWSLDDADPARGRAYKRIVVDEAALCRHLEQAWTLALRPTLTDLEGDAWFLSTPRGVDYFHALYQAGQDQEQDEWRSWQMPTSVNPYIAAEEIEAARNELPERAFAQEFLAQFLSDGTGVFRKVQEAATLEVREPQEGHVYVAGVDWGKLHDFTVISVVDAITHEQVAMERFNRIDYTFQVERLMSVVQKYRPRQIIAEKNSMGEVLIEHLQRRGLPIVAWTATNATKAEVIEALALALERSEITLLDNTVQTGELLAYDLERLPSGLIRYGAPSGMHDDTVIALALAWQSVAAARTHVPARSSYGFGGRVGTTNPTSPRWPVPARVA